MARRLLPYAAGAAGVLAITAGIGLVRRWLDLPTLPVAYVLLVMYLGARAGHGPALATAALAFLIYEFFFVPPYGTLYISAPRDLVSLIVLLAAAAVGERLVAALVARTAGAEASAREAATLYRVAIAALRESDVEGALGVLCELAASDGGLTAMSVVAVAPDGAELLAGPSLTPAELGQARTAVAAGHDLGARLADGRLELFEQFPASPAYLRLAEAVAVLRRVPGRAPDLRFVAALLGLAALLLDRRRAEAAASRAEELAASDRLKAAILSSLSHELRSPLASLRAGLTTLVMPEAGLAAEQRALVEGLDRQTSRLDRLVGDLLTMSRLESGLPDRREPQAMAELVGAVLGRMAPRLGDLDVQVNLPDDLPDVHADELQLERVLTNLLENAAEWTPPEGRVTIGGRAVRDEVEAWIENAGPPIRASDLEHVFDTFYTSRRGGLGLGLAIARRVVESHGGSIHAENRRGGPRFVIRLPAARRPAVVG